MEAIAVAVAFNFDFDSVGHVGNGQETVEVGTLSHNRAYYLWPRPLMHLIYLPDPQYTSKKPEPEPEPESNSQKQKRM